MPAMYVTQARQGGRNTKFIYCFDNKVRFFIGFVVVVVKVKLKLISTGWPIQLGIQSP